MTDASMDWSWRSFASGRFVWLFSENRSRIGCGFGDRGRIRDHVTIQFARPAFPWRLRSVFHRVRGRRARHPLAQCRRLPLETALVWFYLPVLDCLRLIPLRLWRGRRHSSPDREHFHYRLSARVGERGL